MPICEVRIVFVDDILVACKDKDLLEAVVQRFKMNRREHKVELVQERVNPGVREIELVAGVLRSRRNG